MAIEIVAVKREKSGSAAARRMRSAGRLPGVIYNRTGTVHQVELELHGFEMMLRHHASENLIVDVQLDGAPLGKALLKDVQHDPITGHVLHVDFLEISMTEKLRVSIPVELTGEATGVLEQGGILEHVLREIEVECLPSDLVEVFKVPVNALKLNESLLVRDLNLGSAYTVLTSGALAVALVTEPKEEEAPAEAAAVAGAATEPEVIRKGKEEEGEGGAAEEPAKGGGKEKAAAGGGKEKAAGGGKEKSGGKDKGG